MYKAKIKEAIRKFRKKPTKQNHYKLMYLVVCNQIERGNY